MEQRGWLAITSALVFVAGCAAPRPVTAPVKDSPPQPPLQQGNAALSSFGKAKRALAKIYADHALTFYCRCRYRGSKVNHASCGYVPQRQSRRARRLEWEHIVPAAQFGRSFSAWTQGHPECVNPKGEVYRGRRCARKTVREFRFMEADMYNLVPAIGELNRKRSNYPMGIIAGEKRNFGACDIEFLDRKIEPRPDIRGDIARTYLYMDAAYRGRGIITPQERGLFAEWNEADPVDDWECERARQIKAIQRNVNWIVARACRRAGR